MPLRVIDPRHGHIAHFHRAPAPVSHARDCAARDVVWGSRSIAVPAHSPLNGRADVWFRLERVSQVRAVAWCQNLNLHFLGLWREPYQQSSSTSVDDAASCRVVGFGFRVPHFSRYRYVDSDDDEDDKDDANTGVPTSTANNATDEITPRVEPTTPVRDERIAARHARLRRAGHTPARPRPGVRPVPVVGVSSALFRDDDEDTPPQRHHQQTPLRQRPRMSTRDMFDLDDLTDPDDGVDPDADRGKGEDVDADSEEPTLLPEDAFRVPRFPDDESGMAPRDAVEGDASAGGGFGRAEELLPGPSDPQRLHRLRDAIFTPMRRSSASQSTILPRSFKTEPRLTDVDMSDASPSWGLVGDIDDEGGIDEDDGPGEDEFTFGVQEEKEEDDVEGAVTRAADTFAEESEAPAQLIGESFVLSTLPFPKNDYSVVAKREGLHVDPGLSLGRSFRVSFSSTGDVFAPLYDVDRGLVVRNVHVLDGQPSLERSAFARLLAAHCSVWHESMNGDDMKKAEVDATQNVTVKRTVRLPSFAKAFRSGLVADKVMTEMIRILSSLHEGGDVNAKHASIAFALLFALYKSVDVSDDSESVDGIQCLLRRVAKWGCERGGVAFDGDRNRLEGLQRAVVDLSLGEVDSAVDAAVEAGHFRLALLIARALEGSKDELRDDALEQLRAYGLQRRSIGGHIDDIVDNDDDDDDGDRDGESKDSRWDHILHNVAHDANVSVHERMILLILAGHVAPVARFLDFSWYRTFILELLYGAGSSDDEQWRRVAAAVQSVGRSGIPTVAPHGATEDKDVVYQLLKLYTADGDKLNATGKLYSPSGFGKVHQVMDWRFSWMLHQVLSALIPEASPKGCDALLSDGLSAQLLANGMPLWAFYVLCCAGESDEILKDRLVRDWPDIIHDFAEIRMENGVVSIAEERDEDAMSNGERDGEDGQGEERRDYLEAADFLTEILGIPEAWISEARAVEARVSGDCVEECAQWLECGDARGATLSHSLLMSDVVPGAVVANDMDLLREVSDMLERMEGMACVPNWSCGGGLILGYLRHIVGVPTLRRVNLDTLKELALWVGQYVERIRSDVERCASTLIADGIVTAQRGVLMRTDAETREAWFMSVIGDLEKVPCSKAVRLRLSGEYTIVAKHGFAASRRVAAALPAYRKYLENEEDVDARVDVLMT